MGILKDKSTENLESADHLIHLQHHSSSVHCSYYGCIQVILEIIHERFGINEQKLNENFNSYVNDRAEDDFAGRHNFYFNTVARELFKLIDNKEITFKSIQDYNNKLNSIKAKRVDADYKAKTIGKKESTKMRDRAREVVGYLETIYFKKA